jgi:tryptophan 2,3-dioxygenase
MDRAEILKTMAGDGRTDYEIYLNTQALFACQKPFEELCNGDELQFQIVHQVQELWMKLIICTLLDIEFYIREEDTHRVLSLFRRVHRIQRAMIEIFSFLDTMSPCEYQEIRVGLGNGSGQESPGFRTLLKIGRPLWTAFETHYLEKHGLSVADIYHLRYDHGPAYVVAEALAEYDALFRRFRFHHLQHIERSIGLGSKSLKGRPVKILEKGLEQRFFPELWEIRNQMTDGWGREYGEVRDSLGEGGED